MFSSEAILYIGLSQTLFAMFVIVSRRSLQVHNNILIATLFTIALKFLIHLMHNEHPDFFDIEFSLGLIPLTFGPFMYLYTLFITRQNLKFRSKFLLHFTPFILSIVVYFMVLKDNASLNDVQFLEYDLYLVVKLLFAIGFFLSIVCYTILTIRELHAYRVLIIDLFSFRSASNQLLWLNSLVILFAGTYIFYFIVGGVNAILGKPVFDIVYFSHIGLTALAFVTSYFGIKQPSLFYRNELNQKDDGNETKTREMETNWVEKNKQRLITFVEEEKPYLKPDLTLAFLSENLNIPKHDLTLLLNKYMGINFFQFINEYRIQDVMRKLKDAKFDHLTIQAIAYDSGFHSKSTFNTFFKQYTGKTPSEWKQSEETIAN